MEDGLPDNGGRPDGDRMEIRPYTPGDSVRDIMWKGFARNRQLNVRLPERSVAFDDKACAYLVSGVGDEAASALARLTLECGLLGDDWRFGADSPSPNKARVWPQPSFVGVWSLPFHLQHLPTELVAAKSSSVLPGWRH